MKLQNFALIFIAIVLPISLLLGYYVQTEIDTKKLQATYDEKLISATYDAIKAFQINTANNPYQKIGSSQRRDVEAAINTFMDSFATGIGRSGYGTNEIKPYVPAILFALYDGYYIYSPTYNYEKDDSGEDIGYEHLIKPYFTYTAHYQQGTIDVLISYTLDNYITVSGKIGTEYVNESGYLIDNTSSLESETLSESLLFYTENPVTNEIETSTRTYKYVYYSGGKKYFDEDINRWFVYNNGKQTYIITDLNTDGNPQYIEDTNAKDYMNNEKKVYPGDSVERTFTDWVKNKLGNLRVNNLQFIDDEVRNRNEAELYGYTQNLKIFSGNIEDDDSVFNMHRRDIIKMSIKENLSNAIANYSAHSEAFGTTNAYQMPTLTEAEWDQVSRNICSMAFVQGLPVGFKIYNNYAIINNTRNQNYTDKDGYVFINANNVNSQYHQIDCPRLQTASNDVIGYKKTDFEASAVEIKSSVERKAYYYYKHTNLPCYYCIVSRNYDHANMDNVRKKALQQVIARENNILHH